VAGWEWELLLKIHNWEDLQMKLTNQNVIKAFYNQQEGKIESHTGNLWIDGTGKRLMNYATCLAQRIEGVVVINVTKYSVTTSKIQSKLKSEFAYYPSTVHTTKPVPINTAWLEDYVNIVLA
jgi:hypothetical protein